MINCRISGNHIIQFKFQHQLQTIRTTLKNVANVARHVFYPPLIPYTPSRDNIQGKQINLGTDTDCKLQPGSHKNTASNILFPPQYHIYICDTELARNKLICLPSNFAENPITGVCVERSRYRCVRTGRASNVDISH